MGVNLAARIDTNLSRGPRVCSRSSLAPSIKYISLPNPKGPNAAGRSFSENQQPLTDVVADWLSEHNL